MTLRYIDTAIWTDPWFENLSLDAKLIFIYSWSNDHMNAAGCTPISPKRIGLEVGLTEAKVRSSLLCLAPKIIYFYDFNILWAVNFLAKQTGSSLFMIKVGKDLEKMPPSVGATVFAAYDKLSIPYTPSEKVIDNLTVLYCTDTVLSCTSTKDKIEKIKYAEFVNLTETEYQTLVTGHGDKLTNAFIEKLNNHKGAKGVKYKSDIHAIRSWVIDAVMEKNGNKSKAETGSKKQVYE